jgi:antitoxin component of RelBE/YafQ-DinJ toxin-antitoxin module
MMDSKLTLRLNTTVIEQAKAYAEANNMSLSRLVELLLRKCTNTGFYNLENLPISDWVGIVAEGSAEYSVAKKSRKDLKDEFFKSKK